MLLLLLAATTTLISAALPAYNAPNPSLPQAAGP